jgi:hypothetical protein
MCIGPNMVSIKVFATIKLMASKENTRLSDSFCTCHCALSRQCEAIK